MPIFDKVTVTIPSYLAAAISRQAAKLNRSDTEMIQDALFTYAKENGWLDMTGSEQFTAFDLNMYRWVTDQVAEAAERIVNQNGWRDDITLAAIKDRQSDRKWITAYRELIGGDEFASGNPIKASVNQNIGGYVRARLDAQVKVGPDGKRMTLQVQGELVRSVTLLTKDTA